MPDIRELGRRVKAKYPEYSDLSDEEVGRRVRAKYPEYSDFTDTPKKPPDVAEREDARSIRRNIGIGAEQAGMSIADTAMSLYESGREAIKGNFRPLRENVELAGRGLLRMGAGAARNPLAEAGLTQTIEDLKRRQSERRLASKDPYWLGSQAEHARLEAEAAKDPSLRGQLTRGAVNLGIQALPGIATGVATGGSVPAMAAMGALQSAGDPENLATNVALSSIPTPAARSLRSPILRRPRAGRAAPGLPAGVRAMGPVEQQAAAVPGAARPKAPLYHFQAEAPEIVEAAPKPFGVKLGSERANVPGAVGPRVDQNTMEMLAKGKASPSQPLVDAAARSPWQDSVLAYYRANLLTNPVGRALDLGSTIVNQFADAAARPIAAATDVIVSKLTGKRAITGPSLAGSGRAIGSIPQGLRDAGKVMRTGKQVIDSGVDDVLYGAEVRSGLGKGFDVPVNGVFRVMGAMDAPFRRFGFVRNLHDRARVAAFNEAKRGTIPRNQIDARATQLLDRDDVIAAAVRDGERAVLSEPNKVSSWLAKQTRNSPNARLAVGIVQPFMRIPLNAILRAADFSGVGGIKALYKIARGAGRKAKGESFFRDLEDQRVFAQNVASGSFAPAAFLLGMELEDQGKLEGYYYTSKKDFPDDRVPTSIEIGGEHHDINRLGGYIFAPLFLGATYNRLRKQDVGQANALLRSFSGLIQQAPALGYYGAPAKASRILTADEPGGEIVKEAGSMASGFIPASGALGATAKALDPAKKREAEGFTGPIMSKLPGLRERLPEKKVRKGRAKALRQ